MVNVSKMQSKITKLLGVFNNLISALNESIDQLRDGISANEYAISQLQEDNSCYASKIEEYSVLKNNLEGILHGTSED